VFRYVAFVWNDADGAARASAVSLGRRLGESSSQWRSALDRKGLRVFCADVRDGSSEPYHLHRDAGVVLGKLFRRIGSSVGDPRSVPAPLTMPENQSRAIAESGGRQLVENYWGRYVAFLHDEAASVTRVLRDPSSMLPCFTATFAGVHVYFSRMEDVWRLLGREFTINWKYVAGALCQSALYIHATGLNEVSQVLGGECVEHRGGEVSRAFYWNPLEIANDDPIENPDEAAAAVRAATRDCVHAWASSYSSILHLLSGGLDSSIIFSCLKDAPNQPRITCVNYYSPGSNSDEREYARLVANGSGFELIERERDTSVSLEALSRIQKAPMPADYFFYLDEGRGEAQLAREHGASAVFTGYGGDQLFYRSRAALAAGDYLDRHSAGPALFEVALDAARMDRISVWNVLAQAARAAWFGRRWSVEDERVPGRKSVIRDEVSHDISRDSDLVHPWLRAAKRAPGGKRFHAYQMMFPAGFYNPLGGDADPEPVTPLFSQPLLELAMRIPTWLHTRGGWDRAMARRAFEHDLPRKIVTRRTKGGQEEHAKAILLRDISFASNLLLDGHLVRERILARDQVAEALSPGPRRFLGGNVEIYGCLSAEAWVRQWSAA
jgi:asparagine synthase (glutamine-hydrolysing)